MNIDWRNGRFHADQTPSAEEVIQELRGYDSRPLLILRKCDEKASKQVNDLLTAALASERFQLASQWFHCVKVDEENISESRYRNLFSGRNPAHMILSTADGKNRIHLLGTTSQKVTWGKIASILKRSYRKNPYPAVKQLEKLLSTFDALDTRESELSAQLTRCKEKGKTAQVKKLEKQLAKLQKERDDALKIEEKAKDLMLRADRSKAEEEG